ncbi:MAG: 23S rRNA (uracil(1939)-C(5))-methyltransferase RlmD [Actinobacteria bacterium]|nr:23S rRNA (uracil(1939)-C(5))-methyltransferase RlmD [Actinomycetota bacterium]
MDGARVTIQSLAHGGEGVGRLPDGPTVFVPFTCPGDEVTVSLTEDHGRWARGRVLSIDSPSHDRADPVCPYFGECGGCQWQHVSYGVQTQAKRQSLVDALVRIGGLPDPEVAETVASPHQLGYRNKVELTAQAAPDGLAVGFARAHTNEILRIDSCALLPKRAARLPKALGGAVRFLHSRGATGILRVNLRVSAAGETAVDLWTHTGSFPRAAAARVIADSVKASTVTRTLVRDAEHREISQVEVLHGSGAWHERLDADEYSVSAPSFFQVNTTAAILLRTIVLDLLSPDGTMRIADLYAGAGTFTLPLARQAGEVVAIESSRFALGDLRANLAAADLDADVVPGDAAYALPDLGIFDAAVVDPPRSGITEKAMRALVSARIKRIVYVSCGPATLARDVARLAAAGYAARRFVPVDLFPQTYHLETAALLELP